MSARVLARWAIDRILGAFIIAVIIFYGSSFGIDLAGKDFLYTFEVVLIAGTIVGVISYFIVPRRKAKKKA